MRKFLFRRNFSSIYTNIKEVNFPYTLGGFKKRNLNPNITFGTGEDFFDYSNIKEIRENDRNFINLYVSNLEMSKEFENIIYEKYISYINNVFNFNINSEKNDISISNNLEKLLNYRFFNNLIKNKKKPNNESSNYKLIANSNSNNSNKFYLDKIFLHLNVNKFNKEDSIIQKIENFYSKKLVIINYGTESQEISYIISSPNTNITRRNMVVRMSIWAKINYPIIIEDFSFKFNSYHKYDSNFKIYDDEWHHLLIEFEEDNFTLDFLKVLFPLSFPRLISKLIFPRNNTFDISNFKIADFDFYMKGNPISSNEEQITKNELYYIKHKF